MLLLPLPELRARREQHKLIAGHTHASRGIGIPTVALLAKAGAKVYLTARTEASAQAAIEGIYSEHKGIAQGLIVPLPLELEDLASVFAASALVLQAEKKLDILSTSRLFFLHDMTYK